MNIKLLQIILKIFQLGLIIGVIVACLVGGEIVEISETRGGKSVTL